MTSAAGRALAAAVISLTATLPAAPATAAAAPPEVRVQAPALPASSLQAPAPPAAASGQWWFDWWQVGAVWALGARGQGVTVAVLDTGVDGARPELAGRVLPGSDLITGGDGRRDTSPQGHGTAMAILIAGQGGPSGLVGVAPGAAILPVGDSDTPLAIRWAVDHGAKVINMSYGSYRVCGQAEVEAVRYAVDRGAVLVAAAGNEGAGLGPHSPASCPGVLAVGAVDAGRHVWPRSSPGSYLAASAPGVGIRTVNRGGQPGRGDGTSAASALTAAAVAVVWSRYPTSSNRQVVARILATLQDDADRPGRDDLAGAGVVRLEPAVTAEVAADAPNPVFDALDRVLPPGSAGGTSPGGGTPGGTPGGTSPAVPSPASAVPRAAGATGGVPVAVHPLDDAVRAVLIGLGGLGVLAAAAVAVAAGVLAGRRRSARR